MTKTAKTQSPFPMFNGDFAMNNDAMREGMEKFMSLAGEMTSMSRDGMSAAAESARASAEGVKELNTRAFSYAQGAFSEYVEATKTISGAKTLQEAMELQANYTKSALESYMSEMTAMAALMANTMREAAQPLNAQAGKMVEKVQAAS